MLTGFLLKADQGDKVSPKGWMGGDEEFEGAVSVIRYEREEE